MDLTALQARVGSSMTKKAAWILGRIQNAPETRGDWENFRWEVAYFLDGQATFALPNETDAKQSLKGAAQLIQRLVFHEDICVITMSPLIGFEDGQYRRIDKTRAWESDVRAELARIVPQVWHLVSECKAKKPRSDERCNKLFISKRPSRIYCSAQCQSRAVTKAWRKNVKK